MAIGRDNDFPFLQELDELFGREVDNAWSSLSGR
jgi:hypothetical protein